ncbi:MAG: Spy/CpxP family protein refolding chaperone [Janthinobacterium lividum]
MKNIFRTAAPALITLAFLSTPAWAQTPASGAAPGAAPSTASRAQKHEGFIEKRLTDLHARLQITDQQSSQWDAFAQTMRDSADKTAQAYQERAKNVASLNADDAMKSYAALAQLHADNTQKLATSFSALYAVLSDSQKKTADVLFRNQGAPRPGPRKHKRAAPTQAPESSAAAPTAASN